MEYVLTDRNSTDPNVQWFKRNIPTLTYAKELASGYPDARYILEYRNHAPMGVVPTGRSWPVNQTKEEPK